MFLLPSFPAFIKSHMDVLNCLFIFLLLMHIHCDNACIQTPKTAVLSWIPYLNMFIFIFHISYTSDKQLYRKENYKGMMNYIPVCVIFHSFLLPFLSAAF